MKRAIKYFKTLTGITQHLIAMILVALLVISLVPGYYSQISTWFLILIVIQMALSASHLRFVNLFLETTFLVLAIIGLIPYLGWFFRFIALPVALLDLASFNEGVVFQKVEVFTKESVKSRYDGFKEKRKEKRNKKVKDKDKVIDVDFKEK